MGVATDPRDFAESLVGDVEDVIIKLLARGLLELLGMLVGSFDPEM
jgi:hypothetical protein